MTENSTKTSIILHGHFYQPPRENPQTGVIPKQDSAMPYVDWNERIYNDCYNANCHSRYLDQDGRIISLTNNYEYISFNFGPTLLHWLDEKHPETVELLREADKKSCKRLGHGNAIAQAFNHTILPLDNIRDARLQIKWGIDDFEYHFGRFPEGMWLPECGINDKIVQELYDAGIKFVILSPWQCKRVEDKSHNMIELEQSPAPYAQSYILTGSNGGTISAFFYNHVLAERISFGHILHSADNLYSTLLDIKTNEKPSLIHTATDGEIYGHHEPYGDMALAALIKKVTEREDFVFDNYGSFLDKNPSYLNAELRKGEDGKGTSWSCSHGVSRWYKDCGCHTGGENGWNQAWRTPLRDGLDKLGLKLSRIFNDKIDSIFNGKATGYEVLEKCGKVFSGECSMHDFLKGLHNEYNFSSSDDRMIAHLIFGMKYKHFSFTSCGFFFSDISGIEPRQDIKYAIYAISMIQPFSEEDLLLPFFSDLSHAKSNIKQYGDGMSIAEEEMQELPGHIEASLYFYLNRSCADESEYLDRYGKFILSSYTMKNNTASISIQDTESQDLFESSILSASTDCTGVNLYISDTSLCHSIERYRITNQNIPPRIIDETLLWIDNAMTGIKYNELEKLSQHMRHFSSIIKNSKYTPMETMLLENLGLTLKLIKSLFIGHKYLNQAERFEAIGNMIDFVRKFGRDSDMKSIDSILSGYLYSLIDEIKSTGMNEEIAKAIISTLNLARSHGFEPETKHMQDAIYDYYSNVRRTDVDCSLMRDLYSSLNFK